MTGDRVFNLNIVEGGNPKVGRARLGHAKCGNVHLENQRVPKCVALLAREEGGDGCWLGKI